MNYNLKLLSALLFTVATFSSSFAQQSADFHWLNTPKQWKATKNSVTVTVEPNTDYWRITHYGFIRDSGPFYYREVTGDFEATVKITGQYKELFHQAGLMIRTDNKNWIKTGIEYVDGVQNVSAVVTHNVSDWSVVPRHDSPKSMWLSLLRKGDYVQIKYSFDGVKYDMLRLAYFQPKVKVQIGVVAAAPGKQKFDALFENFTVKAVK
jgi:regulation of enolase protein 1 (concanavalin A-like superfamily)